MQMDAKKSEIKEESPADSSIQSHPAAASSSVADLSAADIANLKLQRLRAQLTAMANEIATLLRIIDATDEDDEED